MSGQGQNGAVLDVRGLTKHFPVTRGLLLAKQVGAIKAVDGVSFAIGKGETFGLVGESGCGKTTIAKLILLLERITQGSILFEGQDVARMSGGGLKHYRSQVQAVFQDPYSSLNPRLRVGHIISEPLRVHRSLSRSQVRERVAELLEIVGLNPDGMVRYPHQFSGGQRQRIAVARALSVDPEFLVLDEPVSALDVSIRAQVMNLLRDIQKRFGLTYLFIAHDLAVVEHMSTKIGVMYLGKLVETSAAEALYHRPLHPYTQALLTAVPVADPERRGEEAVLEGEIPSPLNPPTGCRFHTRCPRVTALCSEMEPVLKDMGDNHFVACPLY